MNQKTNEKTKHIANNVGALGVLGDPIQQGNTQKGITLVALVVTIIVLLILAGVTLNMVLGDDGIISQAQGSSIITELKRLQEEVDIAIAGEKLAKGNEFNIKEYKTLDDFTPAIESKYSDIVGISNGKIYVKSNAAENIKQAAEGIGMEATVQAVSNENGDVKLENASDIKSYKIYGNTVEGESVGKIVEETNQYHIPVIVSGKNIVSAYEFFKDYTEFEEVYIDGRNCVKFKSKGITYFEGFEENKRYTISCWNKCVSINPNNIPGYDIILYVRYTNGSSHGMAAKNIDNGWGISTFTSREQYSVKSAGSNMFDWRTYIYVDVDTFQIEEGSVATAYEPYVEPRLYDIYLSQPLRGNNEVTDYMDFERGIVVRMVDENSQTLENPTEEKIDNIPEILLHSGTNIITVGTDVAPSKIEIEY